MLLELYNIKSYDGSVSFSHLSYCSFLPYFPLFLFPRDSVFCRWAWRLASSVLHPSLQQNQYLRTICTALLSGGWGLMLQLHLKFHPHFKTCRGQIYMPVSHHCYLTRVSAVRSALTFTAAVQAGQPCSRTDVYSSAFANLCELRQLNMLRSLEVSWRDFWITIFSFNEMVQCMQI